MLDIFEYSYMQRALLSAIIIGGLCAIVGVYVVLKGLSFIGAGIAHSSFGGIAVGLALGINPTCSAIIFCLVVAWAIGFVTKKGNVKEDVVIGVFFSSTMAFGIVVLSLVPSWQQDPYSYLFGSILAVTSTDVITAIILTVVVIATVTVFYRQMLFSVFDPEGAKMCGIDSDKIYMILITLIALVVVVSLKVVGAVLVAALIVTPAASAYQLTDRFSHMMCLSVVFGICSCLCGLIGSYFFKIPSGAAIVLFSTFIFFITLIFGCRRRI